LAAPPSTEPDAKAQKNFTDPDSRIMKSKDGFVQAYNAQAAVDAEAQMLYSYCCGIYSSRRIAKACRERVDFMSIVALDGPDFRTISDFRRRHLSALGDLFKQILQLCEKAGLVKLGHVALDGTKIKANASKHKEQQRRHHGRVEWRLAPLATIGSPVGRREQ
jgi:transposase